MHHFIQYLGALLHVSYIHDTLQLGPRALLGILAKKLGKLWRFAKFTKVFYYTVSGLSWQESKMIRTYFCRKFFMLVFYVAFMLHGRYM